MVETLAEADEERLMKLWEGLGYYSRARNLQKAAQEITALGGFPDTYDGLLALPGIGDYTASAIAAAAFGRREPAVDGNVLRVMTRLTDCHDDISDPKTKRAVRAALAESHAGGTGGHPHFQSGHDGAGGHSLWAQYRSPVR